ncbi:MAG: hypothetical protein Q9164_007938, partial [Protoblastenia rupestris]
MKKRQAETALEMVVSHDSPAPKKVRVDEHPESQEHSNGSISISNAPARMNGHHLSNDVGKGPDDVAAADQPEEGVSEEALPGSEEDEDTSAYTSTTRQSAPLEG